MKLTNLIKKLKKYPIPIDKKWIKSVRLFLGKEIFERNLEGKRLLLREVFSGRLLARQFNKIKSMPIIIPLLIIFSLSGGGVVYAAQDSLPSDNILYPVKLASEKVVEKLAPGNETKLNLNLKFASRRLDEINRVLPLEKDGELTKKPLEDFKERMENTANTLEKIQNKEKDRDKRIEIYQKFEQKLADYQSQIDKVEIPKEASEEFESIKEAQKSLIGKESYIGKQIIKEQPPENVKGLKEKAEGKIKAANNKIEETERHIEKLKESAKELGIEDITSHPDYKSIIYRMNKAKEFLDQARSDLKNGNYIGARDKAVNVIEICIDIQILIAKEISKAPQSVLVQGRISNLSDDKSSFLMELSGIKLMDSKYESPEGGLILVSVTENTKIVRGDKKISFSDLDIGNSVRVFGKYGSVAEYDGAKMRTFSAGKIEVVKIGNEFSLFGSVGSVDAESRYIKIEVGDKDITKNIIYVSPDAEITRYGKKVDINAIQVGDFGSFEGYYDKEKDVLVALRIHINVIVPM